MPNRNPTQGVMTADFSSSLTHFITSTGLQDARQRTWSDMTVLEYEAAGTKCLYGGPESGLEPNKSVEK